MDLMKISQFCSVCSKILLENKYGKGMSKGVYGKSYIV